MTIQHHPSDPVLAELAAGTLDPGSALVVATHVSLCPTCRRAVVRFEALGGALLDDLPPTPLSADARDAVMARLDQTPADAARQPIVRDEALPPPLAACDLGPWRWAGRGVHWRAVTLPEAGDSRVFMLRAAPGTQLPHHRHQGQEWTCVLRGAFSHEHGRYGAGDFDEADASVEHHPFVETGETCICVVAMQGGIELQGWLGRLLQPLVRF